MKKDYKSDFPIFLSNPKLVYLDNAATTQKPRSVIDAVSTYLQKTNANIHRGIYKIAEESEELYRQSKEKYAELIGASSDEIIYTHNATYAVNLVTTSLLRSHYLKSWDTILLGIRDHHATILPRQVLAEQTWCNISYIGMTEDYRIDWDDFKKKYDTRVKVVSISAVSNTTGTIFPTQEIGKLVKKDTLYMIDASQAIGKIKVNIQNIGCDILVSTAHKVMWITGLGMLYMKKELIKNLQPGLVGWWTVEDVTTQWYTASFWPEKREPGTPNVIAAVALWEALKYIQTIGWIETIMSHDKGLVDYSLSKFLSRQDTISVFWPMNSEDRIGIFSFSPKTNSNQTRIGEMMALKNIAIRCGWHCTYPLWHYLGQAGACRISTYLYNTRSDIDSFFNELDAIT